MVNNLRQEPLFLRRELALASGYETLLCVPLMAQDRVVGTLQLYGGAERPCRVRACPLASHL